MPYDLTVDKNPMHNMYKLLVRNPIVTAADLKPRSK